MDTSCCDPCSSSDRPYTILQSSNRPTKAKMPSCLCCMAQWNPPLTVQQPSTLAGKNVPLPVLLVQPSGQVNCCLPDSVRFASRHVGCTTDHSSITDVSSSYQNMHIAPQQTRLHFEHARVCLCHCLAAAFRPRHAQLLQCLQHAGTQAITTHARWAQPQRNSTSAADVALVPHQYWLMRWSSAYSTYLWSLA
jgi:hypothetical protein